jgi:HSP20 family protein
MGEKKYSVFEIQVSKSFSSGISTHVDWEPNTNILECGNTLIVEVELPGVNKEDISIYLQGNAELIIRGVKNKPQLNDPAVTYYLFEREFGQFYKKIVVDFPLDTDNIASVMENGVLTVKIPKKESSPISIDIK